jgi:hypothetical protein
MLAEQLTVNRKAQLLVRTIDPVLARLLALLLREWGHELPEEEAAAELHILQEGCNPDDAAKKSIWLTTASYQGPNRIALPLLLEELWRAVEERLHTNPRQHMRLETTLPAQLRAGTECIAVSVNSLSDYGARLGAERELARADEVQLQLDLAGQLLAVRGRIIYCMPKGDLDGAAGYDIGLTYIAPPGMQRRMLRDYIIDSYLQRVRTAFTPAEFAAALSFLQLSPWVRANLATTAHQPPPL